MPKDLLSIRAASREYGVSRERLTRLIARREIAAWTETPGLTAIPRGELERVFRGAKDVESLKEELRPWIAGEVARQVRETLRRLGNAE